MKVHYLGYDEAEYFQVVMEMPSDWKESVNSWVAVKRAINLIRQSLRFYAMKHDFKEADFFLGEMMRIKQRHHLLGMGI